MDTTLHLLVTFSYNINYRQAQNGNEFISRSSINTGLDHLLVHMPILYVIVLI